MLGSVVQVRAVTGCHKQRTGGVGGGGGGSLAQGNCS